MLRKSCHRPGLLVLIFAVALIVVAQTQTPAEAPTGFDNQTNGLVSQSTHHRNREDFEGRDGIPDGLGPVYNAQSCAECHQSPVTGAGSQVVEVRAGHRDKWSNFHEAPGGSLINDRAIHPNIQELVTLNESIRTFRTSLNTLGDGFVEAIDDATLIAIAAAQPEQSGGRIAGQVIEVPVLEAAPGVTRVGRFGWKNQHASLLSFSADAYLNEQGITNQLLPDENTSMGNSVAAYDAVPDPEDVDDIESFAQFIRATKAPPREAHPRRQAQHTRRRPDLQLNRLRYLSRSQHRYRSARYCDQRRDFHGSTGVG